MRLFLTVGFCAEEFFNLFSNDNLSASEFYSLDKRLQCRHQGINFTYNALTKIQYLN